MSSRELAETSALFPITGVRERMREKKNGVLKTAKLNASLAAKIRTKTINNSSIIKFSLKQNNKALALALNAAKINAQRLTEDRMLLQKEVEMCHFEIAYLRQKLLGVTKCMEELQQSVNGHLQTAIQRSRLSENGSCSLLLSDGKPSWDDNIAGKQTGDSQSLRCMQTAMRVPLTHVNDQDSEGGKAAESRLSVGQQMGVPPSISGESCKSVPTPPAEKSSSSPLVDEPLARSEKSGVRLSCVDGRRLTPDLGGVSQVPQNTRSCLLVSQNNPTSECEEVVRPCSNDILPSGSYVTERKKSRSGLSFVFRGNSKTELTDDGLQQTKEAEPVAEATLEISQVSELVSLKANTKSYAKVQANKGKSRQKAIKGVQNGDPSTGQSKCNSDISDNIDLVANTVTVSKESGSRNIERPKSTCRTENSTRVNAVEEITSWKSRGRNEERNSQCLDKNTSRCRKTYVVDLAPPSHETSSLPQKAKRGTFCEKLKDLEIQFQLPKSGSLSSEAQRGEVVSNCGVTNTSQCFNETRNLRRTYVVDTFAKSKWGEKVGDCVETCISQCFNETRNLRRTYVVDPSPPDCMNDCIDLAPEIKKNTHLEKLEDLESHFQNLESISPCNEVSPDASSTHSLPSFQKEIPSQEETLGGLNVKRRKTIRKSQDLGIPWKLSQADAQSVEGNVLQPLLQESYAKKAHKGKPAKGRIHALKERQVADFDVLCLDENAQNGNKGKNKNMTTCTQVMIQASALSVPVGSPPPVLALSLEDEDHLDHAGRNSSKDSQKARGSSTIQNSSAFNKGDNNVSEKQRSGASGQVSQSKKRKGSKQNLKRKRFVANDAMEEYNNSDCALQRREEPKTSQTNQAEWGFLRVPGFRSQQEPCLTKATEASSLCDSTPPDSTGQSKTFMPDSPISGHSHLRLQTAKDQATSETSPAQSAVFTNKPDGYPSGKREQKREQEMVGAPFRSTELQGNENKVLKDLTNASPFNRSPEGVSSVRPSRRTKDPVIYTEPSLTRKLRRGDPFTVTDFLSSPIYKTKRKKLTKPSEKSRKKRKEEIQIL